MSMPVENPNFSARPEQVEEKWKSLTLAFRRCCDPTVFREMTGKLQSSMVTGLMFARMRHAAALGRRIEKSRHFSEPEVFVAKVAKRQKKSADGFL